MLYIWLLFYELYIKKIFNHPITLNLMYFAVVLRFHICKLIVSEVMLHMGNVYFSLY